MYITWKHTILVLIDSLLLLAVGSLVSPESSSPAQGAIVINEVAWGGTAASYADEWIELYNTTAARVTLDGWHLVDDDNLDIPLVGSIPAQGYYLIELDDDDSISNISADLSGGFGSLLANAGEALTLTDHIGIVIDTANADGGAWPTNNGGSPGYYAMERISADLPDTSDNWTSHDGSLSPALDADGSPVRGTPTLRNTASTSAADLVVDKTGPLRIQGSDWITYVLTLENRGNLSATRVILTDQLPFHATYITQTGYPLPTLMYPGLRWDFDLLPITLHPTQLTLTLKTSLSHITTLTNIITATSTTTEATPLNNSAQCTTTILPTSIDLHLSKTGPTQASPGMSLTYYLSIGNTSSLTATDVVLTDTLPPELRFTGQSSPYTFSQIVSDTLLWRVNTLTPGAQHVISLHLELEPTTSPVITNLATLAHRTGEPYNAVWTTTLQPRVQLYALQPGNYGSVSGEAAALINMGSQAVDLAQWCLDDSTASSNRVCFTEGAEISAGEILWLAEIADGFSEAWGFPPHWAAQSQNLPIPLLNGSWPGFTDNGEAAYLLNAQGVPVDVLAYGKGTADAGWQGPTVPHPYPGYETRGQVLYRKLDQTTGKPVQDTDSAQDWAQDPHDPINGRKIRYPGWDLEDLFFPLEVDAGAVITIAVAPEGTLEFISQTLASARHSVLFEGYTLESLPIYHVLNARIQAGVIITTLLEGNPSGGISDDEKWIVAHLHQPPTSTVYFLDGKTPRYQFQHAKYIVIDDHIALISTDNFGEHSLPSDRKENGTFGHRGFVLALADSNVVTYLRQIFQLDCDPMQHTDVCPYGDDYAPPDDVPPLPPMDWTAYPATFSQTLGTRATKLSVYHAPEHSLRDQDALLGMLNATQAGDSIAVMQMSEPNFWGASMSTLVSDPAYNPRLAALVRAAERGVRVRLLLDAYYDDPSTPNSNTMTCLALNGLHMPTLQCHLANVTGLGIHAKVHMVSTNGEQWVHLGSLNGTETANKINREVAIQIQSPDAYAFLNQVFAHDWEHSFGPMVHVAYLPLILHRYRPPVTHPVISEVLINPEGSDTNNEWIEVYNPTSDAIALESWTLGDALSLGDYGDGRYRFPDQAILLAREVKVIAACATTFSTRYGFNPSYEWCNCDAVVPDMVPLPPWEGFGIALGNTSDEVLLMQDGDIIVDSVAWGGDFRAGVIPFPIDADSTFPWGASLKRYPVDRDSETCAEDFYISYSPSPGRVVGSE